MEKIKQIKSELQKVSDIVDEQLIDEIKNLFIDLFSEVSELYSDIKTNKQRFEERKLPHFKSTEDMQDLRDHLDNIRKQLPVW